MTITKTFVQMNVSTDQEGRYWKWINVNKTYEEAVEAINGYADAARIVEKTFNDETFEITEKVLRVTKRRWGGELEEKVF